MTHSAIIDAHAHYEHNRFDADRSQLLHSLPQKGISLAINIGCDLPSSIDSIALAEAYPHIYATVGVHPHEAKTLEADPTILQKLIDLCGHQKVVGYGEIGLDFHYDFSPRDVQRKWFKRQLEIVHAIDLPVIIHSREADEEVFDILSASPIRKGVIHSFSGNAALALKYVDLGFHIGITGVVTFDKTNTLQNAAKIIPLERILLETDAPYMTPAPFRGKRNDSTYLTYVAETIAELKGETVAYVCAQTSQNVKQLFHL